LKNKLAEKTKGAQSEETVLKKAFKYFDLNDNGTVEPDEFAKAIEKIGIQIPTKQVSVCFSVRETGLAASTPPNGSCKGCRPHISFVSFKINFNFIYIK